MNPNDLPAGCAPEVQAVEYGDTSLLSPLLRGDVSALHGSGAAPFQGVVIGELLAITDDGMTPLVRFSGQPGDGALRARSSVDLYGPHIGSPVVLMFEHGDLARPVVIGVLRGQQGWPIADKPVQVEVNADGERMVVSAREQLVLRCGKASITLTKAGKVLIEGSYVLSRSTGVNRVKGGSVQLN